MMRARGTRAQARERSTAQLHHDIVRERRRRAAEVPKASACPAGQMAGTMYQRLQEEPAMTVPIEICLEELDLPPDDDRYIRCVALPGSLSRFPQCGHSQ